MPLNCGIEGGFDIDCSDLKKPGGLYRKVWVFNLGDLRSPIPVQLSSYITNLDFSTYQSQKKPHISARLLFRLNDYYASIAVK